MDLSAKTKAVYSTLEQMIEPTHTALLVVDMQNDYCGEPAARRGLSTAPQRAAVPIIHDLVQCARHSGVLPIFIRGMLDRRGFTHSGVAIANQIHVWGVYGVSPSDGDGSEFMEGIGYEASDLVVNKTRNSAFLGTNLDMLLRCNGIDTVVLVGQSTFACVDTTARDALCHDYYVVVVEDGVASVAEQWEYHEASLKVLRQFLPVRGVATSREIRAVWEPVGSGNGTIKQRAISD
jgi:nicotinamidase-related amidase